MEQLYLILMILIIAAIIFFSSVFIYKKAPRKSIIPQISTTILAVFISIYAFSSQGWDGLIFGLLAAIIALATIISSFALLIFHIAKKNQN